MDAPIPQRWAFKTINDFNQRHLNPSLNYHRPCLFPQTFTDHKGKQRFPYPYDLSMTPYEKFKSLPDAKNHLKSGVTFEILDTIAHEQSDNIAAEQLQKAKQHLFNLIYEQQGKQAI